MAEIAVLLTFDDGPDPNPRETSVTHRILDVVSGQMVVAFFVQTNVSYRMANANGRGAVKRAFDEKHVIAIHTGGFEDHRCHKARVAEPADRDMPGTTNGLDSDMARAKAAIFGLTKEMPKFVRATFGITSDECMEVYKKHNLLHIHWNVDSKDNTGVRLTKPTNKRKTRQRTKEEVIKQLKENTRNEVNAGKKELIFLFHNINTITRDAIKAYIEAIKTQVIAMGHTSKFVSSKAEAEVLLTAKSSKGDQKSACPAGS